MARKRSFKYGKVAVEVVKNFNNEIGLSEQWDIQLKAISVTEKGCPKSAFLGLCSEGLVKNIPTQDYVKKTNKNRMHVLALYEIYKRDPSLSQPTIYKIYSEESGYKNRKGEKAVLTNNNQLDVVICLLEAGFLIK